VPSAETDRYCGPPPAGSSDTARTFGADVSLGMEGRSLFFVLGRGGPPDAAVRAAGGQVVTRLADPRRVLAVAPLDAYAGLSRHPAVALAGPVSIDAQRFGSFAKLVGLDASQQET
jgi:hypothetical protein